MKKITDASLKKLEVGTVLFDTVSGKTVKVTGIRKQWVEIGMALENAESLKRNYRLA